MTWLEWWAANEPPGVPLACVLALLPFAALFVFMLVAFVRHLRGVKP